jgi:HD-GYP domain-containing protein (c-di-GMP phosphodiesterase class II)
MTRTKTRLRPGFLLSKFNPALGKRSYHVENYRDGDDVLSDDAPRQPMSTQVSLSEVLAALSHALDLTEGQPLGHTIRTCLIGMRIAEDLQLAADDRSALFYALLLKDAGCSSNAARMAALFGSDDRYVKPRMKVVDWHNRVGLAFQTALNVGAGRPIAERVRHFMAIARTEGMTRDLIAVRCERGASIARQLGFPESTAQAIRSLDEHWCGLGYPEGLKEEEIPLLARIANIAQTLEAFHDSHGVSGAMQVAKKRRGSWFDPELVDIVLKWERDGEWWRGLRAANTREQLVAAEPADKVRFVDDDGLDEIAKAFADIIDAKSPYTFHHSSRVADYARCIAGELGLDADEQRRLYRAGLLHDIGKLGVSNQILDKAGSLTPAEWHQVREHPKYTLSILSQVSAFGDFAWTAALHHEKLDGSGYAWGLKGKQLDLAARILAVVDIYDAVTTERPYRSGMDHGAAMEILNADRETKLCETVVDATESISRMK